jgi:MinD-like ATPase involved in chromosome partitioning or flagellar assembly
MTARFVVATLAPPRRRWVRDLTRWSTTGDLPAEVITCLAGDELRAVLGTGRQLSLVLVDAGSTALDRDLVAAVLDTRCQVVVVDDGRHRDWEAIGCAELVPELGDPETVAELLGRLGRPSDDSVRRPARALGLGPAAASSTVVAVTGPGGTGASTVAAALAESLASEPGRPVTTALVDGARRASQTVLHAPHDVVPGLTELVDAHRNDAPDPADVRTLLHPVPGRGYDLLLGLRRTRDWAALRPLALHAALDGVARAYGSVVVDHDADLDGMASTGSVEVEERHAVARWAVDRADLVVLVGRPDLAGLHALASVRADLLDHGVDERRVLVVLNGLRAGRLRQHVDVELRRAVGGPFVGLRHVSGVEQAHRSVAPLPRHLVRTVGVAVADALRTAGPAAPRQGGVPVSPGELGTRLDHLGAAPDRSRRAGGEAA